MGYVRSATATNRSSPANSTLNIAITAPANGNLLAIFAYWQGNTSGDTVTTADNVTGNTYTLVDNLNDTISTAWWVASLYAQNIKNGPTTITLTVRAGGIGNSILNLTGYVAEYSGLATSEVLDDHAITWQDHLAAGGNAVHSGTITTANSDDTIVGFTLNLSGAGAASAGTSPISCTLRNSVAKTWYAEDGVWNSSGTLTNGITFTNSAGDTFGTAAMAFRAAGSSPKPSILPLPGAGFLTPADLALFGGGAAALRAIRRNAIISRRSLLGLPR